MASFIPPSIRRLIDEFNKLPGIGPKSAQRLTMHLLHSPEMRIKSLAEAVADLKKGLQFCRICWNIAEGRECAICTNVSRNQQQICVVEEILDVMALEKTREYHGVYHVLHGALSPVDGIGPEQLTIQAFMDRMQTMDNGSAQSTEIILATNPGLEGETTALYLMRLLKSLPVKVTRIARGLPVGGDLDYADEITLTKALQGRAAYGE